MQEDTQDPQEATAIQTVDELMQRITEAYDALPRQLKSVATYIEQHRSNVMMDRTGRRTVPQIYVGERHIGGYDDLSALDRAGGLDPLLAAP